MPFYPFDVSVNLRDNSVRRFGFLEFKNDKVVFTVQCKNVNNSGFLCIELNPYQIIAFRSIVVNAKVWEEARKLLNDMTFQLPFRDIVKM